ncbi:methylated-DNA--[protein]-cysteine S-methyltransferase [Shewanella sp. A14]
MMPIITAPLIQSIVTSPVGLLSLKASEHGLTHLQVYDLTTINAEVSIQSSLTLTTSSDPINNEQLEYKALQHINITTAQLSEYFAGNRKQFSVALAPKGTQFQQEVWQALSQLPFGENCSYSDIANTIGRPKAVRAVGAANGANPIAIIVPCHRVIGKGGKLTGYAYGLEMKQWLLNLEGVE